MAARDPSCRWRQRSRAHGPGTDMPASRCPTLRAGNGRGRARCGSPSSTPGSGLFARARWCPGRKTPGNVRSSSTAGAGSISNASGRRSGRSRPASVVLRRARRPVRGGTRPQRDPTAFRGRSETASCPVSRTRGEGTVDWAGRLRCRSMHGSIRPHWRPSSIGSFPVPRPTIPSGWRPGPRYGAGSAWCRAVPAPARPPSQRPSWPCSSISGSSHPAGLRSPPPPGRPQPACRKRYAGVTGSWCREPRRSKATRRRRPRCTDGSSAANAAAGARGRSTRSSSTRDRWSTSRSWRG